MSRVLFSRLEGLYSNNLNIWQRYQGRCYIWYILSYTIKVLNAYLQNNINCKDNSNGRNTQNIIKVAC